MDVVQQIKILERAAVEAARPKPRTVEDFVNDMISEKKTLAHALVVAGNTRWKGLSKRIKEYYRERANRKNEKVSS